MAASKAPRFGSRLAFILVTAGSAIGLGNVWSFPFVVGQNGGGAFILIYLLALGLVATPIFMAELLLGRLGAASPPEALKRVARQAGSSQPWQLLGAVGAITLVFILSFYAVIAGEAMAYAFEGALGHFDGVTAEDTRALDGGFKASIMVPLIWGGAFIAISAWIVSKKVTDGIEQAGRFLMPILFVMLLGLVVYGGLRGDMRTALDFLFAVRLSDLTPGVMLEAVGQAFFTLGIGVGGIMMLGAYMGEDVNLAKATLWIVLLDLAVALLAGLAIFPLVFAEPGVEPGAGPSLIFVTLPIVFGALPGGALIAFIFFLLLTFAAITSAISMMAPSVGWLEDRGMARAKAAFLIGLALILLSLLTILSFNHWSDFYPLGFIGIDKTFFALIREGASNYIMPLMGLCFALIVGWKLDLQQIRAGLGIEHAKIFAAFLFVLRFVVPVAIVALFINVALLG